MGTILHLRNTLCAMFCSAVIGCVSLLQPFAVNASESDTTPELPSTGIYYTASETLTEQMNAVFAGEINLAADANRTPVDISLAVSSSLDVYTTYYAYCSATQYSGMQCYIYAQAAYAALFDELPYHGYDSFGYVYSTQVMGHAPAANYTLFTDCKVMPGAYLRTTGNADGSYNGSNGHSLIVLGYNEEGITILEGNADGRGLIHIITYTWERFNESLLTKTGRVISHVVQPREENYIADYGISFDALIAGENGSENTTPTESYAIHRSGQSLQLPVYSENLTWTSSNPTIAAVDENGLVTAYTDGTVTITAANGTETYTFALILTLVSWDALGDISGNAQIDTGDAINILEYYTGTLLSSTDSPDDAALLRADVDDNGAIDSADAVLVLQYYTNTMLNGTAISAETQWKALL